MKKRLVHVSPIQLGIVLAVLYGLFTLVILAFFGMTSMFVFLSRHQVSGFSPPAVPAFPGIFLGGFMMLFLPILQATFGFICGALGAFIYNLVAKLTGGIEITVANAPEPWNP